MVQRFRVNLKTPCMVGRRRAVDPPNASTYYDELERRWRMVIAGREENSISREQMLIRRISVDTIEVTPQSEKVSCYVDDIKLPKQQSSIIAISKPAALLRCGGIVVHLRRV
jgi:hypothetical protein